MIEYFENVLRSMGFEDEVSKNILSDVSGFASLEVLQQSAKKLDPSSRTAIGEKMKKLQPGTHPVETLEFLKGHFSDAEIEAMLGDVFPAVFNRYMTFGAGAMTIGSGKDSEYLS
jgi:hypothetical protein